MFALSVEEMELLALVVMEFPTLVLLMTDAVSAVVMELAATLDAILLIVKNALVMEKVVFGATVSKMEKSATTALSQVHLPVTLKLLKLLLLAPISGKIYQLLNKDLLLVLLPVLSSEQSLELHF